MRFDPFAHEITWDPYPTYRLLRAEAPVLHDPEHDVWFIFRFADVLAAAHDHRTFSSAFGPSLRGEVQGPNPTIFSMDNPAHDRHRATVSRLFTPRAVGRLEAVVRELVEDARASLRDPDEVEVMSALAVPVPIVLVGDLLGVEPSDREQFRRWADDLVHQDPLRPETVAAGREARGAIAEYFGHVIERRRAEPADDLVSVLLASEVDGRPMTLADIVPFCFVLIVAGTETTTNLVANAVLALAAHPHERRRVREDRSLVPDALEETLRWDAPVHGLGRTTTREVVVAGTSIPEGARVQLRWGSANRDEREFPDADRFDVGRRISRHVAFGHGVHFCLGAALARMEARLMLDALLDELGEWEVDLDGVERWPSAEVRGPVRLPVRPG